MGSVGVITLALACIWPLALPVLITLVIMHLLLAAHSVAPSISAYVILLAVSLAMPGSAYLAGVFLDRFAFDRLGARSFRLLGFVLVYALFIESGTLADGIEFAIKATPMVPLSLVPAMLATLLSKMIFCAAVVTVVIVFVHLLVELPFAWFMGSSVGGGVLSVASWRPLSIALLLGVAFHLMTALWIYELSPNKLLVTP